MKEDDKKYTDSGIEIKKVYTYPDLYQSPAPKGFEEVPGDFPFTRGVQARYVSRQVMDHATICRLQYGRRKQQAVSLSYFTGRKRA